MRDQMFSILTSVDHDPSTPHPDSYQPHNHTKSSRTTVYPSTNAASNLNI